MKMKTRKGGYPSLTDGITFSIKPPISKSMTIRTTKYSTEWPCNQPVSSRLKYLRATGIHALPDDLLTIVMLAVSSTASSPQDMINVMLTCRRFCAFATHPTVLANAAVPVFTVKAESWSDGAHRFLKKCADAGNIEARYTLGMIMFYCLNDRTRGASLLAKAAMENHALALHSLAVIQFNGSGGSRRDKNLKAGVSLCARAAFFGHVDSMRELGHCLQDGYGITKNVAEGRRLLLEANAREAAAAISSCPDRVLKAAIHMTDTAGKFTCYHHGREAAALHKSDASELAAEVLDQNNLFHADLESSMTAKLLWTRGICFLLSDFGCNVPSPKRHSTNVFLVNWFSLRPPAPGLRLCSHTNCGRPETRRHEFRRCSACGLAHYCSRACQALDWKIRHKHDCPPLPLWRNEVGNDDHLNRPFAFEDYL